MPVKEVLARTMWGEARSEGAEGMQAVASVVLNRLKFSPSWWGETIKGVCLKPYQFTCWNPHDPNRLKLLAVTDADPQYSVALKLASYALDGSLVDNTKGATMYQVIGTGAAWSRGATISAIIGRQEFYALPPNG